MSEEQKQIGYILDYIELNNQAIIGLRKRIEAIEEWIRLFEGQLKRMGSK